jgi:rubredoxin
MKNKNLKTEAVKYLTFTCPNCKGNRLEFIETDSIVSTAITRLDVEGDFDYGTPCVDDSYLDRFQCIVCGYILRDENGDKITDNLDVVKWIKEHKKAHKK